ncbi:hypothetical protein POM88_023908 [Heracleum sosnowskyi]|uniref:Uncharacterized protein n=1 Tax=Heracleum sosnowskyi TaxID=360622 RepID=A0AAD8IKB0_9APIA|nr:hypothetical protein POM88_023908 [Heracleum sosnowskyi]
MKWINGSDEMRQEAEFSPTLRPNFFSNWGYIFYSIKPQSESSEYRGVMNWAAANPSPAGGPPLSASSCSHTCMRMLSSRSDNGRFDFSGRQVTGMVGLKQR